MIEYKHSKQPMKLSKSLSLHGHDVSYNNLMKILRKKDVLINGIRVNKDVVVNQNDLIKIYVPKNPSSVLTKTIPIIYQDNNIVIVDKPAGLETEGEFSVTTVLQNMGYNALAVHRLDKNTQGIMVFALNAIAKEELDLAFFQKRVHKIYRAEVAGFLDPPENTLSAYLFKDSSKSEVIISKTPKDGYVSIKTGYKVIKELELTSLIDVYLYTGRTHQIRAHMAFIGHPVIGDGKYGDYKINNQLKAKTQRLKAYSLSFEFKDGVLSYLNQKTFLTNTDFN
ncbi:MAG TPA: RluA family pseudouridine synthase [Clostridia bacterium]